MKILLVNLKTEDIRDNYFPLGLAYIASALKAYDVEVYDLNIENDFIVKIVSEKFDIVAFSCYTGMFYQASQLAQQVKFLMPSTLCIIGGYHASADYEYILRNYTEFDVAVMGRGEKPFVEIANALLIGKPIHDINSIALRDDTGKVIINTNTDSIISNYYIPKREDEKKYFLQESKEKISCISTMRGCYYNCSFCSIHLNDYVSISSYEEIKMDVENIVLNGSNSLYFTNPDFLSNNVCLNNTLKVLDEFPQIKTFKIATRSDNVIKNKELLVRLFERGCNSIELGVESFSNSQLKRYNKKVDADQNKEAYFILKEYAEDFEFKTIYELIPFDPWVSRKELMDTIEFYMKNKVDYLELEPWLFVRLILYPNTVLRNRAECEKIVAANSHIETPYWKFVNNDSAEIFSAFYKYRYTILPTISDIRNRIEKWLKRKELSSFNNMLLIKIKDHLEKCTVEYLFDLIVNDVDKYDKLYSNMMLKIQEFNYKILMIEESETMR